MIPESALTSAGCTTDTIIRAFRVRETAGRSRTTTTCGPPRKPTPSWKTPQLPQLMASIHLHLERFPVTGRPPTMRGRFALTPT